MSINKKVIDLFRNIAAFGTSIPPSVHQTIPYYSQWESKSLVKKIIKKELLARKDPLWKNSGALSPKEYEYWSWNICGMACFKMIFEKKFKKKIRTITIAKSSIPFGVYSPDRTQIKGMYYYPFCKFILAKFGLTSFVAEHLSIRLIKSSLAQNKFVIASVSPHIRDTHESVPQRGGHLVVMVGYDKKFLYLHNPSGYMNESQENYQISLEKFKKYFAYRGIIIS